MGPEKVGEQTLGLQAMAGFPAGAVLIGDRNFGIFGVACAADRHGHAVLIRLTKQRAGHLAGGSLEPGLDTKITWQPTRWDSCGGPYEAQAAVTGRLLCVSAFAPNQQEPLYLFTTLDLPVEQIAPLYALRWNVETGLRSIKQAAKTQVAPRRISFANVYTLLETFASDLYAQRNSDAADPFWDRIIRMAAQYKLPHRTKSRCYPRTVWPKPKSFPAKHTAS